MKFVNNENGYLLILTLVVLSVISLFLLSFIQISASHNKQIEQTSDTYEVTSLAEMGVEYFDALITEEINSILSNMAILINNINLSNFKTVEAYYSEVNRIQKDTVSKIHTSIQSILLNHLQKEVKLAIPNTQFSLINYVTSSNVYSMEIVGSNKIGKQKKIKSEVKIPSEDQLFQITFPPINPEENNDDTDDQDNDTPTIYDKYTLDLTEKSKELKSDLFVNGALTLKLSNSNNQVKSLSINGATVVAKSINLVNRDKKNNLISLEKNSIFCLIEKTKLDLSNIFQLKGGNPLVYILDTDGKNLTDHGNQIEYLKKEQFENKCKVTLTNGNISTKPEDSGEDEYLEIKPVSITVYSFDYKSFLTDVEY